MDWGPSSGYLKRTSQIMCDELGPKAKQSTAVKADAAEQLMAGKAATAKTAEDAGVEPSKVKHDAVERSPQMQTHQIRRSL